MEIEVKNNQKLAVASISVISPYILTTATSQLQPQLKSGPAAPVPTDMGVEPKDQKQGEKRRNTSCMRILWFYLTATRVEKDI